MVWGPGTIKRSTLSELLYFDPSFLPVFFTHHPTYAGLFLFLWSPWQDWLWYHSRGLGFIYHTTEGPTTVNEFVRQPNGEYIQHAYTLRMCCTKCYFNWHSPTSASRLSGAFPMLRAQKQSVKCNTLLALHVRLLAWLVFLFWQGGVR